MIARLSPLHDPPPLPPELDPAYFGFTEEDLDVPSSSKGIHGPAILPLREILDRLRNTYCRSIGAQFMHIDDLHVREWLQSRMESSQNRLTLTREEQTRILTRLTDAVIFEDFVQKKFRGAKSFSLEGCESLIPLLDLAIEKAGEQKLDEIVIGMAHRGRLNVLANIMGKNPRDIFREFEDTDGELHLGRGDVKNHLGYSADWKTTAGHAVHLSLCFNPSQLEYVNPVALGRMRAKQDREADFDRVRGTAILIHGDAAFAGEGIVQETLNLSQLEAYRIGGALHVIVNNQIGFTTGLDQSRSTPYCTDVAKMLQIPIFHHRSRVERCAGAELSSAVPRRRSPRNAVRGLLQRCWDAALSAAAPPHRAGARASRAHGAGIRFRTVLRHAPHRPSPPHPHRLPPPRRHRLRQSPLHRDRLLPGPRHERDRPAVEEPGRAAVDLLRPPHEEMHPVPQLPMPGDDLPVPRRLLRLALALPLEPIRGEEAVLVSVLLHQIVLVQRHQQKHVSRPHDESLVPDRLAERLPEQAWDLLAGVRPPPLALRPRLSPLQRLHPVRLPVVSEHHLEPCPGKAGVRAEPAAQQRGQHVVLRAGLGDDIHRHLDEVRPVRLAVGDHRRPARGEVRLGFPIR